MVTDAELIFWVVVGVIAIGAFWWLSHFPSTSVSEQTIKRIENGGRHL